MTDLATLLTSCLTAATEPEPKQRRARKGAVAGSLWEREVPVGRDTIGRILAYAENKERFVYEGHWASLIGLRATEAGIIASISSEVAGRQITASLTVGYASPLESKLFSGEWTRCYSSRLLTAEARIFPTQLLPTVTATTFGAVVGIKAGIRRRRWLLGRWLFGEWQTFEIRGFRITREWGELLTDSDSLDYVSPRFVWRTA